LPQRLRRANYRSGAIPARSRECNVMKASLILIVSAVLWATAPVNAQQLDLSTVKCKEFLASGKENIALVLMWMEGYYTDQDAAPIVDFDKMKKDAQALGEYCTKNPNHSLITAAEKVVEQ
jgi:acid stress chaperone HdeB